MLILVNIKKIDFFMLIFQLEILPLVILSTLLINNTHIVILAGF